MIKRLEIWFGAAVEPPKNWLYALSILCILSDDIKGNNFIVHKDDDRKVTGITVNYEPISGFIDGWEQAIAALLTIVCNKYETDNPERVMWVFGMGQKIIWHEPEAPTFDEEVFVIEVNEREDLHGRNPLNPNREVLRAAVKENRIFRRRKKTVEEDHY